MAALENIGNLWDQLSELHQKDPQKYQEVIEESAKEYAKLKLPPLPHTCILVREKVIKCCSNPFCRFLTNSDFFIIKDFLGLISCFNFFFISGSDFIANPVASMMTYPDLYFFLIGYFCR